MWYDNHTILAIFHDSRLVQNLSKNCAKRVICMRNTHNLTPWMHQMHKSDKNIPIQAKGMSLQMQRIKWSWLQKHIISNSQQIPHYEYRVIFLSSNDIVRLITISSKNQCVVIIWLKQNGGYFFSLLTFPAPSPLRALESLRWPAGFPRGKGQLGSRGNLAGDKNSLAVVAKAESFFEDLRSTYFQW